MLETNNDGQVHVRDLYLDPVCLRAIQSLTDLHERDSDKTAAAKIADFIARQAHSALQERSEELAALHDLRWINIKTASHADIQAAIESLITYALFRRLHAADFERDAMLSQLVDQQKTETRNAPATGWGEKIATATRDMINRRAAE